MTRKEATTHLVIRTSPTGPGQKFIGRCPQCGQTGLFSADALKPCPNQLGLTSDEALVLAIEGNAG